MIQKPNNKTKTPKAIDRKYYWIQDIVQYEQLLVYWRLGDINLSDYFTTPPPWINIMFECEEKITHTRY